MRVGLNVICRFRHNGTLILKMIFDERKAHRIRRRVKYRYISCSRNVQLCVQKSRRQETVLFYFIPLIHVTSLEIFHGKVDENKDFS